jgi:hypothetical protein
MVSLYFKGEERKEKREKNIVDDNTSKNNHCALPLEKEDAVKNPMTLQKEVFHCRIQPQALPRSNITTDMMKRATHVSTTFLFYLLNYHMAPMSK